MFVRVDFVEIMGRVLGDGRMRGKCGGFFGGKIHKVIYMIVLQHHDISSYATTNNNGNTDNVNNTHNNNTYNTTNKTN